MNLNVRCETGIKDNFDHNLGQNDDLWVVFL